jgi:AcrR family transcriptional regulator
MNDARRDAILRAAARLFEHYGHNKTTMVEVAREAAVGVGSVYLEFDSKEELVRELSIATHESVLAKMREAVVAARDEEEALVAALVARTKAFLAMRTRGQHACELLHCTSEAVQAARSRFRDEELEIVERVLNAGRPNTFGTTDPQYTATLVLRAFASLSPPWIYKWPAEQALDSARDLIALLLVGLLKRNDADRSPSRPVRKRRTT